MEGTIAEIVESTKTFSDQENGNAIHEHFEKNASCKGVVILKENDIPVGLIMRSNFYQMIGTKFGFSIYLHRPVQLLMKKEILFVDINLNFAQFGMQAMSREDKDIYDFVMVLDKGFYCGVISISRFLEIMSEMKQREIELLSNQQRILKEAHEKEVQFREEIEIKNKSIKNLMNNVDQGFLSFDETLHIYEEHSNVCTDIFGFEIAGMKFTELMKNVLPLDEYKLMESTLSSLFMQKKKSRAETYLKLLPNEFVFNNRFIHILFKTISFNENKIIMVILTDMTDKKSLEKKNQDEKNNMRLIMSALNNKEVIIEELKKSKEFFHVTSIETLDSDRPSLEIVKELFRIIHTMKGDFALRAFHNTALNLHEIEDFLAKFLKDDDILDKHLIKEYLLNINYESLINQDITIIKEYLGGNYFETEKQISISKDRIDLLITLIEERFEEKDSDFLKKEIDRLSYETINSIVSSYCEYTQILAMKLNKSINELVITGDTVYIDRQKYSNFLKSMIHLFRNIVDHGIEYPEERLENSKDEYGNITCDIKANEENITIRISDDGEGINPTIIRKRALEKGIFTEKDLDSMSHDEIVNIIFMDNFSTKESVSTISGRGVGLAALKNEILVLGGSIEVQSKVNIGTTFTAILPSSPRLFLTCNAQRS